MKITDDLRDHFRGELRVCLEVILNDHGGVLVLLEQRVQLKLRQPKLNQLEVSFLEAFWDLERLDVLGDGQLDGLRLIRVWSYLRR